MYGHFYIATQFVSKGVVGDGAGSDHRPVASVVVERAPELLVFGQGRGLGLSGWRPSESLARRLARRWAEWAPTSAAGVQEALERRG